MHHHDTDRATLKFGDRALLDARSWDVERRLQDMEKDGIAVKRSPMPELLSPASIGLTGTNGESLHWGAAREFLGLNP